MHIPHPGITLQQKVWQTLTRIRRTLGVGPKQMAELMTLSLADYLRLQREGKDPPAYAVLHLCRNVNISFDLFMMDSFCYRTMARQYFDDHSAIPEKYLIAGKSKRHVLSNMLDFVESVSDWQWRLELMRYLQINESALADPHGAINLRCTVDAIEWLERQSKSDTALERLGEKIMLGVQTPVTIGELKSCHSIYDLFDALSFESGLSYRHFEKNILWTIDKVVPNDKILIRGHLSDEVREQIGERHLKSRAAAVVRASMMSAAPKILGWDNVPVRVVDPFTSDSSSYGVEVDISQFVKSHPRSRLTLAN